MSERKKIDQLFKEKFKDFDPSPNEEIWSKIEARLNEKENRKKRVVPLWWRIGGIAATLALLFTLGYYFFSTAISTEELPVTNNEKNKPDDNEVIEYKSQDKIKELYKNEPDIVITNDSLNDKDPLTENVKDNFDNIKESKTTHPPLNNKIREILVEKNAETTKKFVKDKGRKIREIPALNETNKVANLKGEVKNNLVDMDRNENKLTSDKNRENKVLIENSNALTQNDQIKAVDNDSLPRVNLIEKNSTNKEAVIAESDEQKEKKSIYDALSEKDDLKDKQQKGANRWSINPSVAPVYYNSLGEGSPIHTQFADNSKTGNINMSYGINLAYKINSRLSIRSGINKVNLGYDTKDIAITSVAFQAAPISSISYANTTANLRISDRPGENLSAAQNREVKSEIPGVNGVLNQRLGYLEVPLELKYKITDKKLGVHLIGGFSSLFLTDNSIDVVSNDFVTNVGEANNINNTSFSTNIGVGVDYKLTNKILLNLEPIFKYQLNAFSDGDNGFKPYTIGLYTGLSFRF